MTIITIAAAALAAVITYRNHRLNHALPLGVTSPGIDGIRQSTAVILAVANGLWAILDALMFLRSGGTPAATAATSGTPLRRTTFGSTMAADVVA